MPSYQNNLTNSTTHIYKGNNHEITPMLERELIYFYLGKGFASINDCPKPDVNDTSFLLWMEEVKMWLRDQFNIYAWVSPSYTINENTYHPRLDFLGKGSMKIHTKYDTYEDALMNTLFEAKKYL